MYEGEEGDRELITPTIYDVDKLLRYRSNARHDTPPNDFSGRAWISTLNKRLALKSGKHLGGKK